MPIVELGNLSDAVACYRSQMTVKAIMSWPSDENARNSFLCTIWTYHLGESKKLIEDTPDPATISDPLEARIVAADRGTYQAIREEYKRWFEEDGGHFAIANAKSFFDYIEELCKINRDILAAGLALVLIRQMSVHHADLPGGASVNKAMYLLEKMPKELPLPHNMRDLRRAWSNYKPVLHFCAAFFECYMRADMKRHGDQKEIQCDFDELMTYRFPEFLSLVDTYQRFGTSFIPARAKGEALIDPETAWLLPEQKQWPIIDHPASPLGGWMLEAAKNYRAPVPSA